MEVYGSHDVGCLKREVSCDEMYEVMFMLVWSMRLVVMKCIELCLCWFGT